MEYPVRPVVVATTVPAASRGSTVTEAYAPPPLPDRPSRPHT